MRDLKNSGIWGQSLSLHQYLDSDRDGVYDSVDQYKSRVGDKKNLGCLLPDTDGNGHKDDRNACPEVPGADEDSCPLENSDKDKIFDIEDDCVFEK